jgi:BolA family transcriptional regulator, general stress-responsive regulator
MSQSVAPFPTATRLERIRAALQTLNPSHLEVIDDSARHRGHAGAASGLGHFNVVIYADVFAGLSPIAKHRLVYQALGSLMETDIHALGIQAHSGVPAVQA